MTSEDLQAHYRTELARMLGPEGGRYVNPKTTAWMLKHTAATEGGTYTPETGASEIPSFFHIKSIRRNPS